MGNSSELSGRERFLRMLEHRDHDRIPRHDSYWPETIQRWQTEGLDGDGSTVHQLLRDDLGGVCWSWPVPFPGRYEVISEDDETRVVRGPMGKVERRWKNRSGTPEHISFDCDSPIKWRTKYRPALLDAGLSVNVEEAKRRFVAVRRSGKFCPLQGVEAFECIRQLSGDVIILSAMVEHPDWIRDMAITYTDLLLRDFQALLDAGIEADAIWVYGDLAYNHGPFFSPKMYRELIWPEHRRMCQWAHERGLKFIYHTDGDIRPLVDLFVEAGFDAIQPMEAKAGVDVRELAPQYGKCLSFFGNIDMVIAGSGDRDRLEEEVRTKLAAAMPHRAYAYHSDHTVPPTVSWETYRFLIELLDQYGNYD